MKVKNDATRIAATRQLAHIALNVANHPVITDSEAFLLLAAQLYSESSALCVVTLHAFGILGSTAENQQVFTDMGLVPLVLSFIGTEADEQTLAAIQVIGNLCHSDAVQAAVGEAGGIGRIVPYLEDESEKLRRVAAGVLGNLAIHTPNCPRIKNAGAIPLLVDMLTDDANPNSDPLTAEIAVGAIRNLLSDESILDDVMETRIVPALLHLVAHGTEDSKEMATELMAYLSSEVPELPLSGSDMLDIGDDEL
jgi:vacuolar protein 8